MEQYQTIVLFFQQGGIFMFLITMVLAVGCAIAIERYLCLFRTQRANIAVWNRTLPSINNRDYQKAISLIGDDQYSMSTVLSYGLKTAINTNDRRKIEISMEQGLMETIPALEKRTHYLATFANIATLLGLLGTIIGLTQAFNAISNVDAAEKASLLSSSISLAMNTTAYGLMVAIPLLLIYTYLHTKTSHAVDTLETATIKFLNQVTIQEPAQQ